MSATYTPDAIIADLLAWVNAPERSWSEPMAAEHARVPVIDRRTLGAVRLLIAAPESVYEPASRASDREQHTIDLGLVAPCDASNTQRVGELERLMDSIRRRACRMTAGGCRHTRAEVFRFDADRLRQDGVFIGVLRMTFEGTEELGAGGWGGAGGVG